MVLSSLKLIPNTDEDDILLRKRDQPRLQRQELRYQHQSGPLFLHGPHVQDPRQGTIGDCYLLCALASIAHARPQNIEAMIQPVNAEDTFQCIFFRKLTSSTFQKESITIDSAVPVDGKSGRPIYARATPRPSLGFPLWPLLAEKAYAKWKGGYHVIGEGGLVENVLEELTGEKTRLFFVAEHHPEVLWTVCLRAMKEGWPTTACTYGRQVRPGLDTLGFHPNHIHIILGVHTCRNQRIVQLRDPFDKPTRGLLNLPDPNGVFTLSWENFLSYFAEIHVNSNKALEIPSAEHPIVSIKRALEQSYIFHSLPLHTRQQMALGFRKIHVKAATPLIREGRAADAYYLIRSGRASVDVLNTSSRRNRKVATLVAGDQFGELSLITDKLTASTVRAQTQLTAYKMSRTKFMGWLSKFPFLKDLFLRRFQLQLWMQNVSMPLTSVSLDRLLTSGTEETFRRGKIIFRKGDIGESFYLVLDGSVEVLRNRSNKKIKAIKRGEIFGEIAAIKRLPRSATVRTLETTKTLRVNIKDLNQIAENFNVLQKQLEFIAQRRLQKIYKRRPR